MRLARSDSTQIVAAAGTAVGRGTAAAVGGQRKRAPKGAVQALVTRTLSNGVGKTPDEIKAQAENGHDRMIARSSIRAHLRAGQKDGRYVKRGGRWYLANAATADFAEGGQAD